MQDAAGSLDPLEINNADDNYTNSITLDCGRAVAVLNFNNLNYTYRVSPGKKSSNAFLILVSSAGSEIISL